MKLAIKTGMDQFVLCLSRTSVEEIVRTKNVSGSGVNLADRAFHIHGRAEAYAKSVGLVGVGIISFQEQRYATWVRRIFKATCKKN